jgi:hypothetical protein
MTPLSAALLLVSQGLHCFPCADNKRPTCPAGFHNASTGPAALRHLWTEYPGPLVGVRTGEPSWLIVVDIDRKHPKAWEWWADNRDDFPTTRAHRTRSGGIHLLFGYASGIKCSVGQIAPGIDIRSDGGYIIHWPSAGFPVLCDAAIAPLPAWLERRLRIEPRPINNVVQLVPNMERRALRGLVRTLVAAGEGKRNRVLFWAACRAAEMIDAGNLSEGEAIAELTAAATYVGLEARETTRTIQSGLKAGRKSA